MVYAQINEDKICVAVSESGIAISGDDIIELDIFDASILGKKYNNGKWEDVYVEPVQPQPTQLDRIENNTKYLMGNASALDVLLGVTENE